MRTRGLWVCACLALLAGTGSAQEYRATLNGVISDAQDARVPAALVTLTNEGTGAKSTTVSTASGQYIAPLLPPGAYTVNVEAPGFKRYLRSGVQLSTNERVTLDIRM